MTRSQILTMFSQSERLSSKAAADTTDFLLDIGLAFGLNNFDIMVQTYYDCLNADQATSEQVATIAEAYRLPIYRPICFVYGSHDPTIGELSEIMNGAPIPFDKFKTALETMLQIKNGDYGKEFFLN